ncbi:MAG: hypothetical protein D6696_14160, partial [Acidobacteria bacterium]
MHLPTWLELAISGHTVRRALRAAAVVGLIQIAINHGDNLLRGEIDAVRLLKMFLTASVPYMVSTYSSVSAMLHLRRLKGGSGSP